MSPLEQVLAAAKSIASKGKVPTLALIKTKLGNTLPMPILIQGLQQFKSMDSDAIKQLSELEPQPVAKTGKESEIDELRLELAQLKTCYQQMSKRLAKLEALNLEGKK
ncbi:hypothetical protein [Shewanella sp. UCD-KL12]|uniref:hypothetical protein n=1 Tax=Shewanella sp. UCD-KL12 TaxID=1917163 RepID=UPI000970A5D9|nr:hypothetical protein [Shewanella sp. UCD-KL12]